MSATVANDSKPISEAGLKPSAFCSLECRGEIRLLRLRSPEGTNRLTRECVLELIDVVGRLALEGRPLVLTGNEKFFSAGADLREILHLNAPNAYEFSAMGQRLMQLVDEFPAPVIAAISGYCMGGGLDLALACQKRIAAPNAVLGHRGAALGLITGWGGTQRLSRLVGKDRALQMLVSAERLTAEQGLRMGLVASVVDNPVAAAVAHIAHGSEFARLCPAGIP